MRILILDNYDSFTYNLYHMIEAVMPDHVRLDVRRNDEISLAEAASYHKIVISPGPGLPARAGITCDLIDRYSAEKSILGVCLGHQAIAEVFGGSLQNLPTVLHGVAIQTTVVRRDEPLFYGCPESFETGRYHSWVIDPATFPSELEVTAIDSNRLIMAVRHRKYDVRGVQFHPESIMTGVGQTILKNWLELAT
jgi:anthranilate synthase component II